MADEHDRSATIGHAPGMPATVDVEAFLTDGNAEVERCAAQHWWADGPDLGAGPMPIVLSWDAVRDTLADRRLSPRSFAEGMVASGVSRETAFQVAPLFSLSGDEHRHMRAALSTAFTPRQVERLRPMAARTAEELAGAIAASGGSCEFVSAFAEPLPPKVFAELFGLPVEDAGRLAGWATDIGRGFSLSITAEDVELVEAAAGEMKAYALGHIEMCRKDPGDDLVSRMLAAEVEGRAMTDDEIVAMVTGFVFAGAETTRRQLTLAIQVFADNPELWRHLGDEPDAIPHAVEELLRHSGIVPGLTRRAEEPFSIGDLSVEADADVLCTFHSANHDAAHFPDPDVFDLERDNAANHVTFGWGPHYCVGAGLARMDIAESLRVLTGRFGPPVVTAAGPSSALVAPDQLWVEFGQ